MNIVKKIKKQQKQKNKHKLGLALGGGGARGFAHLGVLKAFEEEGIFFDEISGTSVGSLVGALYAYGLSSEEIIRLALALKTKDIKTGFLFKPSSTEKIEELMKESIGDVLIEELKIPFTAVAVDLITGKEIHLTKGSVAKAVAASCAVPLVFTPVEYEGYRLVDGGLANTNPADVLRINGCKNVITVDINHTRGSGTESTKLLPMLKATLGILMKSNAVKGKMYSDVVIEPDLTKFKSTKFDGYLKMIEIGYLETKRKMPEIKLLLGLEKHSFWSSIFKRNKEKILKEQEEETITK